MSLLTSLLKLFKWNTTDETDLEQEFDIDKAMNDNWDKLDDFAERVNDAVIEIQDDIEEIQNKNTEQDETINTINESISSIQAKDEAQDTEIDKQSDLIQKLKDNCINVTTEESTSLHVTDASILPAKLDVRGNQRQEAREGYNVLQNKLTSNTINGVTFTINEDKSVTLNGTATNNIITNLITGKYDDNNATNPLIIPENITNYRLSGCPSGGSWSTYKLDIYGKDNNLIGTDLGEGADISKNSGDISELARVRIIVYKGAVLNNVTFYPMITYGTEEKPYEQYGASPSLDYPSPVRAVGDNVNIFPDDLYNYFSSNQNAIKELNGKEFKITTTANRYSGIYLNSNNDFYKDLINKIKEKIVTYSFDVKADSDIQLLFGTTGYETIRNVNNNWQRLQVTYEKKEPGIYFYNSSATVTTFYIRNIKLIFGEGDNLYSPYGQGSVEIKKINKNWAEIDTSRTVERSGLNIEVDNEGVFTLNGTTTANMYINLLDISEYQNTTLSSYKIPVKKYKAYFELISKNNSDGSVFLNVRNFAASSVGEQATTYCAFDNLIAEDVGIQIKDCNITKDRVVAYLYIASGAKLDDFKFKFALYNEDETDTTYEKHEEQSYILDIQKPMLLGDYFVKEADGWKEVHIWNKLIFTGQENWNKSGVSTDEIFVATLDIENGVDGYGYSNYFRYYGYVEIGCFSVYNNGANIRFCVDSSVISDINRFKTMLADKYASGDSVYVYYKLSTPNKLACTEAQSNILDQLSELPLFAGTNNIITAESLALMQMQYIADTETYIDNRIDEKLTNINQQILNIVGGN